MNHNPADMQESHAKKHGHMLKLHVFRVLFSHVSVCFDSCHMQNSATKSETLGHCLSISELHIFMARMQDVIVQEQHTAAAVQLTSVQLHIFLLSQPDYRMVTIST